MARTEFDQLLDRYLRGQVSEEERIKIEAWLDVMKTDKSIPHFLTKDEEDILFQKINSGIDNIEDIKAYRPLGEKGKSHFFGPPIKIAAAIILLLTVSFVIWNSLRKDSQFTDIVFKEGVGKKILEDGSIVWLQKGSKLSYSESADHKTRNAILIGGGLFEIYKDASRPFIISCGDVNVQVLGTSFSVKTDSDGIELKVLTGLVHLSSSIDKAGINVQPNEKVAYKNSGENEAGKLAENEIDLMTAKTEYRMKFENQPMSDVLEKIRNKFDVKIEVAEKQLIKCRITADFTDNSLDKTLRMLTALLDIEYSINGTTVLVSGRGCN